MTTDDQILEQRARAIVVAKNVYKGVVTLWAIAAVVMVLVWWLTTPGGYFWPVWPIIGIVVAAVIWGLATYGKPPFRVSQAQVDREKARLRASGR